MSKKQSPQQASAANTDNIIKKAGKVSEDKANRRAMRQAIDQGIAEYRKQYQEKVRQQDKKMKKAILDAESQRNAYEKKLKALDNEPQLIKKQYALPWTLLALSWVGFIAFFIVKG